MFKFVFALVLFVVSVAGFAAQTEVFWQNVMCGLIVLCAIWFYAVLMETKDEVFGTTKGL